MGIFKEKKSRNKNIKSYNRITLDAKHNLKIKSFQDLLKSINKYKKILKNKIEKYNKISTKSNLENECRNTQQVFGPECWAINPASNIRNML